MITECIFEYLKKYFYRYNTGKSVKASQSKLITKTT